MGSRGLLQREIERITEEMLPMHMPGHKRRLKPSDCLPYDWDITEISGADDLHDAEGIIAESEAIRDDILPKMCELRVACDEAETLTDRSYWPYPTYGDILFSVK